MSRKTLRPLGARAAATAAPLDTRVVIVRLRAAGYTVKLLGERVSWEAPLRDPKPGTRLELAQLTQWLRAHEKEGRAWLRLEAQKQLLVGAAP